MHKGGPLFVDRRSNKSYNDGDPRAFPQWVVRNEEQAFMKKSRDNRKKRKTGPVGKQSRRDSILGMLLRDLLLTAGILVVFSLFHHVIPHLNREPCPSRHRFPRSHPCGRRPLPRR